MEFADEGGDIRREVQSIAREDEVQIDVAVPIHHGPRVAPRGDQGHGQGVCLQWRVHHAGQITP
jgi:hypothetical protein